MRKQEQSVLEAMKALAEGYPILLSEPEQSGNLFGID